MGPGWDRTRDPWLKCMDKIQMFHFASVEVQCFLACCVCDKYHTDTKGLVNWILWGVGI